MWGSTGTERIEARLRKKYWPSKVKENQKTPIEKKVVFP